MLLQIPPSLRVPDITPKFRTVAIYAIFEK